MVLGRIFFILTPACRPAISAHRFYFCPFWGHAVQALIVLPQAWLRRTWSPGRPPSGLPRPSHPSPQRLLQGRFLSPAVVWEPTPAAGPPLPASPASRVTWRCPPHTSPATVRPQAGLAARPPAPLREAPLRLRCRGWDCALGSSGQVRGGRPAEAAGELIPFASRWCPRPGTGGRPGEGLGRRVGRGRGRYSWETGALLEATGPGGAAGSQRRLSIWPWRDQAGVSAGHSLAPLLHPVSICTLSRSEPELCAGKVDLRGYLQPWDLVSCKWSPRSRLLGWEEPSPRTSVSGPGTLFNVFCVMQIARLFETWFLHL